MTKPLFIPLMLMAAVVLSLGGCADDKLPAGVMTEEQMVDFLTEAYLIEGFYAIETGYHYENLEEEIVASYQSLLDSMGITRQQYESSRDYYMRHAERYERIHAQAVDRLDSISGVSVVAPGDGQDNSLFDE